MGATVAVTRPNFLPLAVVIVLAALAGAFYAHAAFNAVNAVLVLIASVLLHASVNAYNNFFDYGSGIDSKTMKTPFSGGVDLLVTGKVKPRTTFLVATVCLLVATLIGIYFLSQYLMLLLPLMIYGAVAIVAYSPVLARIPAVSEILAGTGFGFIGLGTYITQTGLIDATGISILVPVTILVALLLFLNEFPDTAIDKGAGRRHLVVLLGKGKAVWMYPAGLLATYLSILISILIGAAPPTALIALATSPLAYKASRIALSNYDNSPQLVPALGTNVVLILTTIVLLAVGFVAGVVLKTVRF